MAFVLLGERSIVTQPHLKANMVNTIIRYFFFIFFFIKRYL